MWSHQTQWTCWKSTWSSLADRYKLSVILTCGWKTWKWFTVCILIFLFTIPSDSYSFSSWAQRYPSHWTCQSYQLQFWLCKGTGLWILYHHHVNCVILPAAVLCNSLCLPVGKQRDLFLEVWWHKSREGGGKILHWYQGHGGVAWWVLTLIYTFFFFFFFLIKA